jgi:hypothetical protein
VLVKAPTRKDGGALFPTPGGPAASGNFPAYYFFAASANPAAASFTQKAAWCGVFARPAGLLKSNQQNCLSATVGAIIERLFEALTCVTE